MHLLVGGTSRGLCWLVGCGLGGHAQDQVTKVSGDLHTVAS